MADASLRISASRGLSPLVLVIAALIGSAVIPARQTSQILELLHQTTQGLPPASVQARDARVRRLEQISISWNIVLVITAFAGLSAVIVLMTRERHALADAQRRSRRESSLRGAAEAMAGAFTIAELMQCVTDAACRIAHGRSAFVMRVVPGNTPALVVAAASGAGAPRSGTATAFAGSRVEAALKAGAPAIIAASDPQGGFVGAGEPILVVPLGSVAHPIGALFVVSGPHSRFRSDDVAYAGTFGHLASLAIEKVRTLDEAREARRKLERVLASRSRLIRGFSHDVKNPVGAADGYAALLTEGVYGTLGAEQRDEVGRIRRSIHSALALIDDLHELGRAETGRLAVELELVNLHALLEEMVQEYQAAAHAAGLDLTTCAGPRIPEVTTSGVRVRQIVSNLLSNAIKYTPSGAITVEIAARDTDCGGSPGDWIQVRVTDTGPGIPPDRQEFIFEEFSRIGPRDKSGAGLGLAISQLLAGALGGRITLESTPGHGSCFILWLPVTGPALSVSRSDRGAEHV